MFMPIHPNIWRHGDGSCVRLVVVEAEILQHITAKSYESHGV